MERDTDYRTLVSMITDLRESVARIEERVASFAILPEIEKRITHHELHDAAIHSKLWERVAVLDKRLSAAWRLGGGLLAGAWALVLAVLGKVWHAGS